MHHPRGWWHYGPYNPPPDPGMVRVKEYLHVVFPTFDDWVTACSNTVELEKMNSSQKEDYNNIREATGVTGPDKGGRVKYCRSRLRSMGYFNPEKVIAI